MVNVRSFIVKKKKKKDKWMMTPFVLAHRSSDSLDVKMTDEFVLQQQQHQQQQQQPCGSHWARVSDNVDSQSVARHFTTSSFPQVEEEEESWAQSGTDSLCSASATSKTTRKEKERKRSFSFFFPCGRPRPGDGHVRSPMGGMH